MLRAIVPWGIGKVTCLVASILVLTERPSESERLSFGSFLIFDFGFCWWVVPFFHWIDVIKWLTDLVLSKAMK